MKSIKHETAKWYMDHIKLPFGEFVWKAIEHDRSRKNDSYWEEGELFYFAWLLRGHAEMQPHLRDPSRAIKIVEAFLIQSTTDCRENCAEPTHGFCDDPWAEWFGIDGADARASFADAWIKARSMPGQALLQRAIVAAKESRLLLPAALADIRPLGKPGMRDEKDYEFFISVAGHLQVIIGEKPIILPCHALAALFGVRARTISRYRQWAIEDGYLTMTKAHKLVHPHSKQNSASEFRFDLSRFSMATASP